MQGSASSSSPSPSPSPSSPQSPLLSRVRLEVHEVKPLKKDYEHDPKHRLNWKTKYTSSSRIVESVYGEEVQSKLNKASPLLQGILAFMFRHLLQSIGSGGEGGDVGESGGKHQNQMITFLRKFVEHCAYGKLHTAKKYKDYANIMRIGEEYCPDWFNAYNSEYIILTKRARYESFQALLDLLDDPSSIYVLSNTDMEKIVDGIVCMLALPDSVFQKCFDRTGGALPPDHHFYRGPSESTTQTPGSFYIELLHALEEAVETLWSGKTHEESVITCNGGLRGVGRDSYFNIKDIYF